MERGSAVEPSWADMLADTPFAAALAKGAPLWIARGAASEVVFANPAALALFETRSLADFEQFVLFDSGPGGRRFRKLAAETSPGGPPRLERLRFFVDRKPVACDWLCARFARGDQTFFVAAQPGPETAAERGREAAAEAPTQRFVWRLDGADRFAAPDPALAARLGANAPGEGETIGDLTQRLGLDGAWKDAVAARAPFSRLALVWPTGAGREAPAQISGAPMFGAGETYQGFRGFCLMMGDREAPVPTPSAIMAQAGDAASLIRLLQRQHAPGVPAAPDPGAPHGPALAVISALAALLQPKPPEEPKPARAPAPSGAEIVVLHPQSGAAAPAPDDSVELSAQERQNFKDIALALSPTLRPHGPTPDPAPEQPVAPAPVEAAPPPASVASGDFAELVEMLPIAVLVLRGDEALFANRLLLNLTGYSDLEDFRARGGARAIFGGGDPRALTPGGSVSALPLVADGGRMLSVDAHVREVVWGGRPADLVAMRRSYEAERPDEVRVLEREAEAHAARARDYSVALEAARDGMVKLDRAGRIVAMNRGAERLFGRTQATANGESLLALFSPAGQAAVKGAFDRVAAGQKSFEAVEAEARVAAGRALPAKVEIGRLSGEPEPEFFVLLSQRTDAEMGADETRAALEQSEKENHAKTELLSSVSHEMRTPLHAILGFAEVMLEERFGPIGNERYRDYVRDIHASGRHVLSLANDLLDLTRIKLGKMELQFTPLDLNMVVRECVTLMQPQAARERVIMRLSLADKLPQVMADERSLRQIMLNLMANAVKYNEPGGQVIVSSALDDAGAVILRVRDTGVGMNEHELALALEPFRRVPGAKSGEGAGLGLPLTKALVEANHADFSIKSRKDQGTLVEIAFPVRQAAQ